MAEERLKKQMDFIVEVDKIKDIFRQNYLTDGSRRENDAEHSWHIALMSFLLLEHADDNSINLLKVMKMLLIHDLVEVYAGDTFAYDEKGYEDKLERETAAAKKLFGLLPEDQTKELIELWEEFETLESPEAIYAGSLDRLQPLIQNYHSQGKSWVSHDVSSAKVHKRMAVIKDSSESLGKFSDELIEKAEKKGWLK